MGQLFKAVVLICILFPFAAGCGNNCGTPGKSSTGFGPGRVSNYTFSECRTRMIIPEEWNKNVVIRRMPVKREDDFLAEYDIIFKRFTGKEDAFLGAIFIFSLDQWDAFPEEWKGAYTRLTEIDGELYVYKSNQSNPYDPDSRLGREYESHLISMPEAPEKIVIEKIKR